MPQANSSSASATGRAHFQDELRELEQRARDQHHVGRPFALVRVVARVEGRAEDLAVELVDLALLLDQLNGQRQVALAERGGALRDLRSRARAHLAEQPEQLALHGRLVAREGDQLGDVDALIAHPLDVHDHVKQRCHESQVSGHRCLTCEQREHALVHLEVASVDAVVVGDHHLRQVHVLTHQRLERAVQLLEHDVQAAERLPLELGELVVEVRPALRTARFGVDALGAHAIIRSGR